MKPVEEIQADKLKVKVYESRDSMGKDAACEAAAIISNLIFIKEYTKNRIK